MRRIIRPGDWASLRRKAQDAVYPNPPEPEPESSPRSRAAMTKIVQSAVRKASFTRTTFPGDARQFSAVTKITLTGKELLDAAGDPAVRSDLSDRADFIVRMLNIGCDETEAMVRLERVSNESEYCEHCNQSETPRPCRCPSFCSCRLSLGHCGPKRRIRFIEPAKLLRQWNEQMFNQPTLSVAALLTLDRHLATDVVSWARVHHPAWVTRHGLSLVLLEAHHNNIRHANCRLEPLLTRGVHACFTCGLVGTRTCVSSHDLSFGNNVAVTQCNRCRAFESFYVH
jgi:hypothetical protein